MGVGIHFGHQTDRLAHAAPRGSGLLAVFMGPQAAANRPAYIINLVGHAQGVTLLWIQPIAELHHEDVVGWGIEESAHVRGEVEITGPLELVSAL